MGASPPQVDVAIVAPCPIGLDIDDGWLDRIWVVDRLFDDKARLYLNFAPHHGNKLPLVTRRGERAFEALLHPDMPLHKAFVGTIVDQTRVVYVHTVHYAKHVLDWLACGKLLVDIHGTVPEEERMLGRPELAAEYEPIEEAVIRSAKRCVLVSNAMREHYLKKYPDAGLRSILLPVVQEAEPTGPRRVTFRPDVPVNVIYAGGTQVWQNVDAMLQLSARANGSAEFSFLSKEWPAIRAAAQRHGAPVGTKFGVASKQELTAAYEWADFGLVVRDDGVVNRVSCPTKLFDYLRHGVVPIVRSPLLGDFEEYGYSYVTETEFGEGFFPDAVTRRWMIDNNRAVLQKFIAAFQRGMDEVREAAVG
jgi:hypothetical protein